MRIASCLSCLTLAVAAELFAQGALAGAGTANLAAGESRLISADAVYRDITVCNDVGSQGDLLAAIGTSEPVRLAPGMCQWDRGDRITLHNESAAAVASTYKVMTCSDVHNR